MVQKGPQNLRSNSMKLLIVTQVVDRTHSNLSFFLRWIEFFAKRYDQVLVVCLTKGEHALPDNVRVLSLGKESGAGRLTILKNFFTYIWTERKTYDTVLVHMNPEWMALAGVLWRMLRKRLALWYTHGSVTPQLRVAERLTHVVFTASKESFNVHSNKVHVMGHGIDSSLYAFDESEIVNPYHLIAVGRISQTKRQDLAVGTMLALREKGHDATLTVLGTAITEADVSYEQGLRETVEQGGAHKSVDWVGAVPSRDIPGYFSKAGSLIHTSTTGSLDKVVLEAMAAGVLVVSTSEATHAILPEGYQLDQEIEATPESIAVYVEELAQSPRIAAMRKAGRADVESKHSLDSLISRMTELMQK